MHLLKRFIKQCPLENAPNKKLFDKFTKRFNGLYNDGLEEIKSDRGQYLGDEFRDIYQRIGVDVPEDVEVKRSSRGKKRMKESDSDGKNQRRKRRRRKQKKRSLRTKAWVRCRVYVVLP